MSYRFQLQLKDIEKFDFCEQCAAHGHLELLEWGLDNDCPLDSESAIQATKSGNLDLLKFLHFQKSCLITDSCLDMAAKCGNLEITKFLVEHGVEVNLRVWRFACSSRSVETLEYLKEKLDWSLEAENK
jgi:hypothetical protein